MEFVSPELVLVRDGKEFVVTSQTVRPPVVIKVEGSDLPLNSALALAWAGFPHDQILGTGYQVRGSLRGPYPQDNVSRSYIGPYFRWEISGFWPKVSDEISLGGSVPMDRGYARLQELLGISLLENRDPLKLSGGETAKVVLAAHMLNPPQFLVLDRVLGELDADARSRLLSEVKKVLTNTVVVVVDDSAYGNFDLLVSTEGSGAEWKRETDCQNAVPAPVPKRLILRSVRVACKRLPTSIQLDRFCVLRNGVRVFDPVDLQISGGELILLSGRNGCGKTTFLEGLAGLLESEGRAWLTQSGQEPRSDGFVALSPQDPQCDITEGTLNEELALACGSSERANHFLGQLGFREPCISWPLQDDISLQKIASVLAAIARGMPACLLDEPSLYLGTELSAVAVRAIRQYLEADGIAFCSSHDQRFVSDLMASKFSSLGNEKR